MVPFVNRGYTKGVPFWLELVYERVVTLHSFKVYERVGKSVILVYKKAQKG